MKKYSAKQRLEDSDFTKDSMVGDYELWTADCGGQAHSVMVCTECDSLVSYTVVDAEKEQHHFWTGGHQSDVCSKVVLK